MDELNPPQSKDKKQKKGEEPEPTEEERAQSFAEALKQFGEVNDVDPTKF